MFVNEYLVMPPDDRRTLLLYGNMIELPRPGARCSRAVNNLGVILDRWIHQHNQGELRFSVNMVLDEGRALVHSPDISFLAKEHKRRLRNGRLHGPADLCLDIIEGSHLDFAAYRRFADYQCYGVPWYWSWHLDSSPPILEECQLINGRYECRSEIAGAEWFEPGLFPGLVFRLPPLLEGDLKSAVKGKAKKLM